jgi:hypothetical protein
MVGHRICWLAAAISLGSALLAGAAGAAAPENTAVAASGQRSGVAAVRSELVSMRPELPSQWSRLWLDNAIASADWAAESSCWTASGDLVTTTAGLSCLQALRTVVLRLYYADAALRGASQTQRQETVGLIASVAGDRLAAVAAAQGVDESKWRASGPTATLWSVRTDLTHADANPNRIEATIGYIRAWRRLSTDPAVNTPDLNSPAANATPGANDLSGTSSTATTLARPTATAPARHTVKPPAQLTRCKVPNLVGRRLAGALRAIKAGHCRTGTVRHAFSRKGKKGTVIFQNRRSGRLLPAKSKINLQISRGRKH